MIDKMQILPIAIKSAVDHASMQIRNEIEGKIYMDSDAELNINNTSPGSFTIEIDNVSDQEVNDIQECVGDILDRNIKYIKFGN